MLEFRLVMRLLVCVFTASVMLLLWAAWSVAQAVRKHGKTRAAAPKTPGQPGPADEP